MMPLRFHLDEHIHPAIAGGLRRRGVDVTTTIEAGLRSASDTEQLAYALSQSRILVTQDQDFLALHRSGASHAGIVYWDQGTRTVGEVIRMLVLFAENLTADEMRGRIEFI